MKPSDRDPRDEGPRARRAWRLHSAGLAASLLLALPGSGGCGHEGSLPAHVTVELRTDFDPGGELGAVRIEVLETFDDTVIDVGWLTVSDRCKAATGLYSLGTFEVKTGTSRSLRVRATGFRIGAGELHTSFVATQMTLQTEHSARYALSLIRSCEGVFCAGEESCSGESGLCEKLPASAPAAPVAPAPTCAEASGNAPALIADPAFARACEPGDQTCTPPPERCEDTCSGVCERCDVPGHLDECTAVDFSRGSDAAHCGACERACGDAQAFGADCVSGSCQYACREGWADCNRESGVVDGCEQAVDDDPNNCGRCGHECDYALCYASTCAELYGNLSGSSSELLDGQRASVTPITLESTTTLLGIGGRLRNLSHPAAHVRFAVYEADPYKRPMNRRSHSDAVEVIDAAADAPEPEQLTYAAVGPVTLLAGTYFIAVQSDKPVHVLTGTIHVVRYDFDISSFPEGELLGSPVTPYPASLRMELSPTPRPELDLVMLVAPNQVD